MPYYLTLRSAIALARAYAPRRSGLRDTLEDFVAWEEEPAFESAMREVESLLGHLKEQAARLLAIHETFDISPLSRVLYSAQRGSDTVVDAQQEQRVIDALKVFADAPWEDFVAATKANKRGNKPSRSPELDAAVMAVMHYLHAKGHPYRGGWKRPEKREQVAASRTTDTEWTLNEPAKSIVAVLRRVGFESDISEIRGSYDKYVGILNGKISPEGEISEGNSPRHPEFSDYLPDHDRVEYRFK